MKKEAFEESKLKYKKLAQEYAIRAREMMDSGKFKELILGVDPDDPWSEKSVKAAEEGFLSEYYANPDADYTHYILFVGEGFVRKYKAAWGTFVDAFGARATPGSEKLIGIYYPHLENSPFTPLTYLLKHTVECDKYEHAVWWSTILIGEAEFLAWRERFVAKKKKIKK